MSLDMRNVIPYDQWQGRVRLSTRPGLTPIDMFSAGDGEGDGGDSDTEGEIQCIVPCANYADDGSGEQIRTDRLLLVINGQLWQKVSGDVPTRVTTAGTTHFITTGHVSGVQFKGYAYFCDGTNYKKVDLTDEALVDTDVTDWATDCEGTPSGPCTVEHDTPTGTNRARLLVKFGARLAMAGVIGAEEVWFLSAIDDADDWDPDTGGATDSIAGGTSSALGYGTIGEPIEALIPFGQSGLLICGRSSITYLTSDPAFDGTLQMMSRSLGMVSPNAWCPGPGQSAFVLTEEGLLFLEPNIFAVDKSHLVSRGRLDSYFGARSWQDLRVTLVHDVTRSGVWIWLNDINFPETSQHLFYSYATDGFFPVEMSHPRFTGATVGVHAAVANGAGEIGQTMPIFGSDRGVLATFDPVVLCGSDGHKSSHQPANSYTDGTLSALLPAVAEPQRIESHVSIGPLVSPEPSNILIREVTVEAALDEYLPNTQVKGTTSRPRIELIYGESPQGAVGASVTAVTLTKEDEIVLDGEFWDADDEDVVIDGGVWGADWEQADDAGLANGTPWDDDMGVDGGGASRAWDQERWIANDLFNAPDERQYEPVNDSGMVLAREPWPGAADPSRWVVRGPLAGANHDTGEDAGVATEDPVQYVQAMASDGTLPFDLNGLEFHGVAQCYVDAAGSEQCITYSGGSPFGTFDNDVTNGQWNVITDSTYDDGFFRTDRFTTHQADVVDVNLLDLGCLVFGKGNRRRCRVRTQAAFIRVRGVTAGGMNPDADNTSGHPFVLEGITVEADQVGLRRDVEDVSCAGASLPSTLPDIPEGSEPRLGVCCNGGTCTNELMQDCQASGGVWLGALEDIGFTCDDEPCSTTDPLDGACCWQEVDGSYQCEQFSYAYCLILSNSTWHGAGTTCGNVTDCERGKCCFCDGDCGPADGHDVYGCCANMTQAGCTAAGGNAWTAGVTCQSDPCCTPLPDSIVPCCVCDDQHNGCIELTVAECVERGGTPNVGATACNDNMCEVPCVYKCDEMDLSWYCEMMTPFACTNSGGQYYNGADECTCAELETLGYCCAPPKTPGDPSICLGLMPRLQCTQNGPNYTWHDLPTIPCVCGEQPDCGGVPIYDDDCAPIGRAGPCNPPPTTYKCRDEC
jgi:hypothetical protein